MDSALDQLRAHWQALPMGGNLRPATQILTRPDGSAVQLVQKATLSVIRGPDKGRKVTLEGAPITCGAHAACSLVLTDTAVSSRHFEIRSGAKGFRIEDLGSTNGTIIEGLRIGTCWVDSTVVLRLGNSRLRLKPAKDRVEIALASRDRYGRLLGSSVTMRRVFAVLERVAQADVTVLIEGESGTGKELAAESIHLGSSRQSGPLVVVDCGAISENLVESELFGYERGAFTGADHARQGYFEAAQGGTIFLDEIGELPLQTQPKLLRVLERREVTRVGASHPIPVDVRVVAATNRKLAVEVEEGRFRQDLYYRLAVLRVELPPLRERRDDIPALVEHFVEAFPSAAGAPADLGDDLLAMLRGHDWPGNVRELKNVVERLLVLPELGVEAIGARNHQKTAVGEIDALYGLPFHEGRAQWTERFERAYLEEKLRGADGVVLRAAEAAQIPRQTFHRLMKKHGI